MERTVQSQDGVDPEDLEAQLVLRRVRAGLFDEPEMPLRLGRYELRTCIGSGGLGVVYSAVDPELARTIAVKLVRPDLAFGENAIEAQARLLREAQTMAKLSHHHVIHVYDVGTWGDAVWVAMEWVDGQSLRDWVKETTRTTAEILAVLIAAGRGLAAAHAAGLVHRDIKPENVLVDRTGRAYVLDFGLARAVDLHGESAVTIGDDVGADTPPTITRSGALIGTPPYMAPEQYQGDTIGAATDQFAFCITAWEMLLGERPFPGETLAQLMMRICSGVIAPIPRGRSLPSRVQRALERGMAVDPGARHPSMDALLAELAPPRARTWVVAAIAIAAIAGGAFATKAWLDAKTACSGAESVIAGAWDDARTEALRAHMRGADVPYADATADALVKTLDETAARWVDGSRTACESHRRGEQSTALFDAQTACLDVARRSLAATVEALLVLDRDRLPDALELAQRVRDPRRCSEARVVGPWMEAPADPQVADEVAALHGELAEISARGGATGYAAAAAEAEAVLARAGVLAHRPLQAEAGLVVGDLWERAGDRSAAARRLAEALMTAQASTNLDVVVRAAIQLVYLDGVALRELERARVWHQLGLASLEARGDEAELAGGLGNAWAGALFEAGSFAEAATMFGTVLERYTTAFGDDDTRLVAPLNNLAVAQIQLAAFDDAEANLVRAEAIVADNVGPMHPDVGGILHSRAELAWMRGDAAEGEALFRRALQIRSASLGDDHPSTLATEVNLGGVLATLDRLDDAASVLAHVLELGRKRLGDDSDVVLAALETLGNVEAGRKRFGEALALHREVLAARERTLGPNHRDIATVLENIAADLMDLRRDDEAIAALDRHLRILETALAVDHPRLRRGLRMRGDVLVRKGELDRAIADYERALALADEAPLEERVLVRMGLARALLDRDRARALLLGEAALSYAKNGDGGDPEAIAAELARWR